MVKKSVLKLARLLKHKKYRLLENKILIEGRRIVLEALNSNYLIDTILLSSNNNLEHYSKILFKANERQIEINYVSENELNQISNTKNSQSVIALGSFPKYNAISLNNNILYLDHISDPGNLGTLIRTAEWFGIKDILLSDNSVDPYNPKVIRGGMGAHFYLNSLGYCKDINIILKNNYFIIGADINGKSIEKIQLKNKKWMLIIGNEAHGISIDTKKYINQTVKIPGYGKIESLNASVAGGILLNMFTKKK